MEDDLLHYIFIYSSLCRVSVVLFALSSVIAVAKTIGKDGGNKPFLPDAGEIFGPYWAADLASRKTARRKIKIMRTVIDAKQ
jgi:hypothetical protein